MKQIESIESIEIDKSQAGTKTERELVYLAEHINKLIDAVNNLINCKS